MMANHDVNSSRRENPHKYILYKPTITQIMMFLATGLDILNFLLAFVKTTNIMSIKKCIFFRFQRTSCKRRASHVRFSRWMLSNIETRE